MNETREMNRSIRRRSTFRSATVVVREHELSPIDERQEADNVKNKKYINATMDEAKTFIYLMKSFLVNKNLSKKINEIKGVNDNKNAEVKETMKELEGTNIKIKCINKFKKSVEVEMKIAVNLESAAEKLDEETCEEMKNTKDLLNAKQGLTLKNFSLINEPIKDEIVPQLQNINQNMQQLDVIINRSEGSTDANLIATISNKLNELKEIKERCETKKNELDAILLTKIAKQVAITL
ncbi:hypothetical protein O3M35_009963 [Rhynocoris fuscipes]|uniref:Uncharacterized protein n=1 Tax=Rhynocoris fuscipes TaxID=488301 RepID=A0AAW1CXL4_9HEMI